MSHGDTLEKLYLSPGLGMPRCYPWTSYTRWQGRSVLLCLACCLCDPAQDKGQKMDGWMDGMTLKRRFMVENPPRWLNNNNSAKMGGPKFLLITGIITASFTASFKHSNVYYVNCRKHTHTAIVCQTHIKTEKTCTRTHTHTWLW